MEVDGSAQAPRVPSAGGFRAVNHASTQQIPSAPNGAQPTQAAAPSVTSSLARRESGHLSKTSTPTPALLSATDMPPGRLSRPTPDARKSSPSESSLSSVKDATPAEAPIYGTRSRNRPGRARPNYAEKEEVDFELAPIQTTGTPGTDTPSSVQASRSPTVADYQQAQHESSKKAAPGGSGIGAAWNTVNSLSKDTGIPGTSTFSANPNIAMAHPPTRKRKAAQVAAAAGVPTSTSSPSANGSSHFSPAPQSQASTRKATASAAPTPPPRLVRETNMATFEKTRAIVKSGILEADDGTTFAVNDFVYLVCEPPGEPYYLCRVMEFCHDRDDVNGPVDSLRVNWFYRPRDIQKWNNDTRLVYATMHSDICPLTSLRGKARIMHRSEIQDFEEYRKTPDSFWYNQCFDRFIHRYYEVIPTSAVVNVPQKVKKALDERWKFVVVEAARAKELTSAAKSCKRCSEYCAADDSVDCALCQSTYHLNCVRPALAKKPSRGFAWACGPCSRAQEKKLEARRTPIIGDVAIEEEEEVFDEEDEEPATGDGTRAPSPAAANGSDVDHIVQADIALAKMWPMRYLGMHCRVEDALQYDDRAIYPRACTRLGPKHQAHVEPWYGRPVQLVKPANIPKKYTKNTGKGKGEKLTKETLAAIEADKQERLKRPKWVQDEPPGYIARGEDTPGDTTVRVIFKMPGPDERPTGAGGAQVDEKYIDDYMIRARRVANENGLPEFHTNWQDKALQFLMDTEFDVEKALHQLRNIRLRKDLKEPKFTNDEKKRFNEAVAKFGSELRSIRNYVKTQSHADIVRFYYIWKKTPKGKEIWGSYGGRKGQKKKTEQATASKALDIADDQDDSSFDVVKAHERKRQFQCKFCGNRKSRQWRRAPGVTPGQTISADGKSSSKDKSAYLVLALCQACATLWRKYAIEWEPQDEVAKKVVQSGRPYKRRIDEELKKAWDMQNQIAAQGGVDDSDATPSFIPPAAATSATLAVSEPPRKKHKAMPEPETYVPPPPVKPVKEKPLPPPPPPKEPTPPPPPIIPAQPKRKQLPCAVCDVLDQNTIECKDCRLTVHRGCYGVQHDQGAKWVCDMCANDRKELASYEYKCVLCNHEETLWDLIEPPKISHKKKTDRDREKERMEKELCVLYVENYRQAQKEKGRPFYPREPLKRTADNNWVHVNCAVWTPEIKFSNARTMDVVEGIPSIPKARYDQVCKICKASNKGACVGCHVCNAYFHVACAWHNAYEFGFDITPVKSSRREGLNIVTIGPETGVFQAAIWCREHSVKTIVHHMSDVPDPQNGTTVLEMFVRNYKQADLKLTGTTRKANLLDEATKAVVAPAPAVQPEPTTNTRRKSAATAAARASRNSSVGIVDVETLPALKTASEKKCFTCGIDTSPKWWPFNPSTDGPSAVNGIKQESSQNGHSAINGLLNGSDRMMIDLTDDVSVPKVAYQCTKCRYRRLHPPAEPERPKSPTPPPAPAIEPPRPVEAAPPPVLPPPAPAAWMPQSTNAAPPVASWAPQPPLSNGLPHPAQHVPQAPVASAYHPSPYAQHQPNSYPPLSSSANYVPASQSGPPRTSFTSNVPPPLSFRDSPQLGSLGNGMPSPRTHLPLQSPTNGIQLSHQREGSYPLPHFAQGSHASPPPPGPPPAAAAPRPETPRDSTMQDGRMTGASASPSLRNLIH